MNIRIERINIMRKMNCFKILFGVLTMLLLFAAVPEKVSAATEKVGDYEYNVSNGIATIAKYTGSDANVIVPTEVTINGMRYKISKIEASAFANNTTMTSLVIPKGITNIGRSAFKNCTSLTSIKIEGNIADCSGYSSSYGNSSSYSVFYNAGANADSLTVTFTEGVTKIPAYLFATYADASGTHARVTKIVLADTVMDIGTAAFYNCVNLKDIGLSKTKTIGNDAFAHCESLKELILPSQLTTIGERAFDACTTLESISLPKVDCAIKRSAFRNCTALSSITVNSNIADCSGYSSSYGNSSSYSVFYNAGANADSLTVTFTEGVTKVPAHLFATYADTSGTYARVTKVVLADTVTDIGTAAFYNCVNLKEIELSKTKTIGNDAFAYCESLKELILPSQLTTIGERAFDACTALESISLPKVDCAIKRSAFRNCTALSSITVNSNIADCSGYSSSYGNSSSYSVFYNAGANTDSLTVTFTEGVTRVPTYLFATYADTSHTYARVTNVILPETVTEIGQYAFYNCAVLKEITILDGVGTIGKGALDQCGEKFFINVYDNSPAYEYAVENSYNYKLLDWNGWRTRNGEMYWYENGIVQGREGRGKEIYDAGTDAWYWLDAVQGGAKAVSKDVYQESSGGKWVRYDANGHMIKGWQTTEAGTYYFDQVTGAMYKGTHNIDGTDYYFDDTTGILGQAYADGWNNINGVDYWYENGVRQGYDPENPAYRGKEIYDPGSDAWYWLDNVQQGAKAVSKDVYQESYSAYPDREDGTGKWVRYDANGHMVKGWQTTEAGTYYFETVTGAMAKGQVTIDGAGYYFDEVTGILK